MTQMLILAAWAATGVALLVKMSPPGLARWAWAPLAAVLGPLWAAIALEQADTGGKEPARAIGPLR